VEVFFSSLLKLHFMEQGDNFDLIDAPQGQYIVEGRGAGTAGFVISLVALVFWLIAAAIAYAQALFGGGFITAGIWTGLSALGFILSMVGFSQLRNTGGKTGLAIAGIAISSVAVLLCVWMIYNVNSIHSTSSIFTDGINEFQDKFKEAMDSLKNSK
jgi:hypothetical protein